jgi:ATP-binding cassette subfamily B (MDR/TAP) protein 1
MSTEGNTLDVVRGEIAFRAVKFAYPTRPDLIVFRRFDLTIGAGTQVAFVGHSGSGKSTAVNLVQRFYDPMEGTVLLDGMDITSLNLAWLRRQMGMVQQEPILFAGSVAENIRYGREDATDEEIEEVCKTANAHNFISELESGYKTEVGERGAQLSGGQKQRIAIARALIRDPKILLLDEATSALDNESERVVQEALDKLLVVKKRTTLVVAHRLSTIASSDVICFIHEGRIVEKGAYSELMAIPDGHFRKLAERQQEEAPSS